MIAQLALAAALTLASPVDDVQLPTCAIGEEAQPFGDGYVCGPADPAVPELEIPSPGPVFTAEPAPWPDTTLQPTPTPAPPALEADPDPVAPAPAAAPTTPAEPTPQLAETGIVEERITALSVFAAIAIALGAGIVLTLMLRRRPMRAHGFDHLRDENGFYTKLKPTDPGYPYGQSEDPSTAALLPVDLPTQIFQFRDDRREGVLSVSEPDGEHHLRPGIGADVAQDLQPAAAPVDAVADRPSLRGGSTDVAHASSPSSRDREGATSPSFEPTVGGTADTTSGLPSPESDAGGRGAAAGVATPAAPHFTEGDPA